jgi:hypothetical protein
MGVRMSRMATITLLAASLAALVAACGTTVQGSPEPAQSPGTTSSPSTPSPQSQAGQVGDKFTITSGDAKYEVTLVSVDQQAQPESEYASVQSGHHLTAAQFRVTAITSTDENANANATAVGSDEHAYTASFTPVAAGTNFASGAIRLEPGSSLVGWVSFELPNGVRIARVQWTPGAGLSTHTAEWLVNGSPAASPGGTPTSGTSAPTATSPTATSSPGTATPGQTKSPADTVNAYFDAINARDYQKAWDLGGKNSASSYSSFVSGFKTTEMVSVEILDVSGDLGTGVVTARLTTLETDGSTKVFEGTYTVRNSVIVEFSVHQVS